MAFCLKPLMVMTPFLKTAKRFSIAAALFALSFLSASQAFSQEDSVARVSETMTRLKDGGLSSFCYAIENGQIRGINADQPVKIASVMKLLTTYWALDTLGSPDYRYRTKIYYDQTRSDMHIEGSRDPFLNRDRQLLLLTELNRNGITSLNRLTVDQNFLFGSSTVDVSYHANEDARNGSLLRPTDSVLAEIFNTNRWSRDEKRSISKIQKENPGLISGQISFNASSTQVVSENPLAGSSNLRVFEIRSAPLSSYLKRMNIMSANPMADELYYSLGGTPAFRTFISTRLEMGSVGSGIYSGSGLWVGPPRRDTTMPCSAMIQIIRRMDQDLQRKYRKSLADVMMVAGLDTEDGATFKEGEQTLVVKTGTLAGAKNLAGSLTTSQGEVYFGIFMQGKNADEKGKARGEVLETFLSGFRPTPVRGRDGFKFRMLDREMSLRDLTASVIP
ncbi:MAG: hypothetical protein EOP05_03250 [Proteobacteria bacterium]|nr:MAG: hypothetical protein EOP05_03250 [Pseudomonadota bacterium]